VNTLRRFCRCAVSSGHVLLTMIVINSLSFAADPGKNGKIAFIGNLTGTNQIYTVNPDGSGLFQVTNLQGERIGRRPNRLSIRYDWCS
jgi:hypothetical protein